MAALGGNDAFWKYADLLYANTRSNGDGVPPAKLTSLAAGLGIDKARFNECANGNRYAKLIKDELQEGEAAGILGTPGNILRDNRSGKVLLRQEVQGSGLIDALLSPVPEARYTAPQRDLAKRISRLFPHR